jgi:plastocyanin
MKLRITALLTIAALSLAACGSSSKSSGSSSSPSSASKSASVGGGYGAASAKKKTTAVSNTSDQVSVKMEDNFFGTKTITGKPGSTVKVALTNVGQNEHNFKIDSQKQADADVEPGKSATVSVTIPTSGSVQFYCEYHKGLGMVGTVKPS